MKFHHTGCLVDDIDEAISLYKPLFGDGEASEKFYVKSQEVNVCFLPVGDDIYLELVEPLNENSPVYNLKRKGISYYHTAYLVEDIDSSIQMLLERNFKKINDFKSEAFNNKRCSYLISPHMALFELIEA